MPLNDDDPSAEGNLTDEQYSALLDEMEARAAEQDEPPCRLAVPAEAVAEAVHRLDARELETQAADRG
jgi:hypothetical protein